MNPPTHPNAIDYRLNPPVENEALNILFDAAWPAHTPCDFTALLKHCLTYVCAYASDERGDELVGFVKLAWDGGIHAFLLDTTVHPRWQRRGIGRQLVRHAIAAATERGIEWIHVDYEPRLAPFYESCGFHHTTAGLIHLHG